jgi:hypothetical protein
LLWIFAKSREIDGLLVGKKASFEGRRDTREEQGAEVVQTGVDKRGNVGNRDYNGTETSPVSAPSGSAAIPAKG